VAWTEMPSADNPPAPSWCRASHGHTTYVAVMYQFEF
jgi:hypothetical protein